MTHPHGTHLGGIRTLECVRQRCVIDADTGCWHLRLADGTPLPRNKRHVLWLHDLGCVSAPRAVWTLSTGKPVPAGKVVSRHCESYDCARPDHLRCWTKATAYDYLRRHGRTHSIRRTIANRVAGIKRSRLTPELRHWLLESGQSNVAVGHALGIAGSYIGALRKRARDAMAVWQ